MSLADHRRLDSRYSGRLPVSPLSLIARDLRVLEGAALSAIVVILLAVLMDHHPVFEDESIFADPARPGGGFGSPLLSALLPGAGDRVLWQPPGHPVLLHAWFDVFGFGLRQGRMLSAVALAVACWGLYVLCRSVAPRAVAVLAVAAAIVTPWAIDAGEMIRMDSLTAACVVWAIASYRAWLERRSGWHLLGAALAAAAAVLFHPIGAIAATTIVLHLLITRQGVRPAGAFALVAGALVVAIWGAFVAGHWDAFTQQMDLQMGRKARLDPLFLARGNVSHALVAALVVVGLAFARGPHRALYSIWMLVAIAAATVGAEFPYPLYVVTALAPALALAIAAAAPRWRVAIVTLAVLSVVLEAANELRDARAAPSAMGTVRRVAAATAGAETVFIGPGGAAVYFGGRDPSTMRQFVPVPVARARQVAVARRAEALVMQPSPAFYPELDAVARSERRVGSQTSPGVWVAAPAGAATTR